MAIFAHLGSAMKVGGKIYSQNFILKIKKKFLDKRLNLYVLACIKAVYKNKENVDIS
jgi:hypothetical protein